jgi:hypothetical protein
VFWKSVFEAFLMVKLPGGLKRVKEDVLLLYNIFKLWNDCKSCWHLGDRDVVSRLVENSPKAVRTIGEAGYTDS